MSFAWMGSQTNSPEMSWVNEHYELLKKNDLDMPLIHISSRPPISKRRYKACHRGDSSKYNSEEINIWCFLTVRLYYYIEPLFVVLGKALFRLLTHYLSLILIIIIYLTAHSLLACIIWAHRNWIIAYSYSDIQEGHANRSSIATGNLLYFLQRKCSYYRCGLC